MLADIKKLKDSIPNAERVLDLKPKIDELYAARKVIFEKLNVVKAEIETKESELESVRKELEEAKEQRDDIKTQLDKFEADIVQQREDLQKYYTQKDQEREEFYKARLEYETQVDQIRHIDWITKQKQYLEEREKGKQERLVARR